MRRIAAELDARERRTVIAMAAVIVGLHVVGFFVLLALVVPKNYSLGVAGVSFAVYFALSMAITGTYAASLILLGESLFTHSGSRAVPTAALVIAVGLGLWLWRRRHPQSEPRPAE